MNIYDCFIFNHELEMLEIRLNILDKHVDYFVLTESKTTFSGKEKPLHYLENKKMFEKWNDKIIHNVIEIPPVSSPWDREIYSRNSALYAVSYQDDDLLLTSDLDEIPNPLAIENVKNNITDNEHITFKQNCYTYYLNNYHTDMWFGTRASKYSYLKNKTIDEIREATEDILKISGRIQDFGGWHFTYCGDTDHIKEKINSFCDVDLNNELIIGNIENNLTKNSDIFFRNKNYTPINIDESFPEFIKNNQERFRHLIK